MAVLLLDRTFTESGWEFSEAIQQDMEGLPLHVFEEAANPASSRGQRS